MRTLLYTALTMATFGLLAPAPVHAASGWSCIGPHVACGGAHASPRKSARTHHSHKRDYATRGKRHVAKSQARSHRSAQRAERRNKGSARTASAARFSKAAYRGSSHSGMASYYWQGQQTASGARFNPSAMTAAHRTLPFGTKVRVTNKRNGRSVIVTINDRGPFIRGRVIDLSSGAAGVIDMKGAGVAPVSLEVVGG